MPDEATSESKPVEQTEPTPEAPKEAVQGFDPWEADIDTLATKIESDEFPDEPEAEATTEAEAETAPSVDAAVESEPEVEEPTGEAEEKPDDDFSEADELRAMLEVQQSETKRFESLLGRQTGEDGFFKKRAQELERENAELRRAPPSEDPTYTPETAERVTQSQQSTQDRNTTYLINLASTDAFNKFVTSTPGALVKDEATGQQQYDQTFIDTMNEMVLKQGDPDKVYSDPIEAAEEVTRFASMAWAKVDRDKKVVRLETIQRRRAEQGKRLKDKKRASAASSTVRDAGPAPKKPVDPYTMPMEELTKLAQAEGEEEERARS